MNKTFICILGALLVSAASSVAQDTDPRFMSAFTEDFNSSKPEFFGMGGSSFRYSCGVDSFTEKDTKVMLLRINPDDPAGAGRGPEISTPKGTHFGTYSARFRVPDIQKVQPNTGAVSGYFTYRFTRGYGLSEIDIEVLIADPRIIYLGTWTSDPENVNNLQRVGRTINLATGQILYTNYRSYHDGNRNHDFNKDDDAALSPRTIPAIEGFDASKQFYTYGFLTVSHGGSSTLKPGKRLSFGIIREQPLTSQVFRNPRLLIFSTSGIPITGLSIPTRSLSKSLHIHILWKSIG